jgi:hypothetical protein
MPMKKRISMAPVVVDRAEIKRMEMERALFDRCLRQLLAVDAVPATKAYLEKSQNAESAVKRTTADRKIPGGKEPSWALHAELEARNLMHAACMNGRDETLLEMVTGIEAGAAAAAASSTTKRGRGRPKTAPKATADGLKVCLNLPDGHGDAALHHAARGGHLECARILLSNGSNPVAVTKTQYSAMHCAANTNEREMMELLNHYDCDPTLTTFNGLTAAQLARKKGRQCPRHHLQND